MLVKELITAVNNGAYDKAFKELYRDVPAARERFITLLIRYLEDYGNEDAELFSAPGRTEIGGNHTDHQHGQVLAAAINLDAAAVAGKADDIALDSLGYAKIEFPVADYVPVEAEYGTSAALLKGMNALLAEAGYRSGGYHAVVSSNVKGGSGLSSSAAFETLLGAIQNHFYNDDRIDALTIAKLSQKDENIYFGKPCGLMDQCACSLAGFVHINFADIENPAVEPIGFDLRKHGYALCITATPGDHSDLTDEYAAILSEMHSVAQYFGKDYLNDVPADLFWEKLPDLYGKCSDRAVLRACHFFNENQRVSEETNVLAKEDTETFLKLVQASGDSSFRYLQNLYSNQAPQKQPLSLAIALSEHILNGRGAVRVHGGGFAGTIQAFVPVDLESKYIETINAVFGKDSCQSLNIRAQGGITLQRED